MIESRSLPQLGTARQDDSAGAGDRRSGGYDRDLHAGVFDPSVSHGTSDAIAHLRSDGQIRSRLAMGINTLLRGVMPNRNGNTQVVQVESDNNRNRNFQLVSAVSQLSVDGVAERSDNRVRRLDGFGNVDSVSHQTWVMPQILLTKFAIAAGAVALALYAVLENMTSWGDTVAGAISTIVAASFTYLAMLAKNRYERQKDRLADHKTDTQSLLDRERLADERIKGLITEMQAFHSEQVKGLQSSIELMKELAIQDKAIITQQRELITQQAAEIQRLQATIIK